MTDWYWNVVIKILYLSPKAIRCYPVFSINIKFLQSVSLPSRKDFVFLHPKRIN